MFIILSNFAKYPSGLKRCGKSCRLRWMNYLRPEVKHGKYTEEEDALIMKLQEEFGNRLDPILRLAKPPSDLEFNITASTLVMN